jgi:hypothetical protein
MTTAAITVVGGLYQEVCMRPGWREIYGSAGRAASAIAAAGGRVSLFGYADSRARDILNSRAALDGFQFKATAAKTATTFVYTHGLATPVISSPEHTYPPLAIEAENVIRFGMLEADAVVKAKYAVYDPQNVSNPVHFAQNGSTAEHLALVLNKYEAAMLSNVDGTPLQMAKALAASTNAEVIIIKLGPQGALVLDNGTATNIPAFRTKTVWKIGSGDTFVANFAYRWMAGDAASTAALYASKATAFYCEHRGFATAAQVAMYFPNPVRMSDRCVGGYRPKVYLAGPFFSLAQLWMVEEARSQLHALGLEVFSPYHDVGHASAADVASKDLAAIDRSDVLFAIADGLDPGTMYEIGHANAKGKAVIIYCENVADGDMKMMLGAGCTVVKDYVSAVYQTLWKAIEQ